MGVFMMRDELSFIIGGPQGAGIETSATILTYALAYCGIGVISDREYFSNIKGRHSYVHFEISSKTIPQYFTYPVQILASLDHETIFTHYEDLEDGGVLIYDVDVNERSLQNTLSMEEALRNNLSRRFREIGLDGSVKSVVEYLSRERNVNIIPISFSNTIKDIVEKTTLPASQLARYVSSIIIGAIASVLALPLDSIKFALEKRFADKPELVANNELIINTVYEFVKNIGGRVFSLSPPIHEHRELIVVSGNDVIAMAKIVAGLRYQSYYPITPAADESFTLESYERIEIDGHEYGSIIVFQTEDEISAINSAIGAALTGVRSSTSTSGPGFSLMVEGLGWAGMNETPIVITYYQRGGPSTGLPTRGGQSDLLFSLYASHGEFSRIIIASGDHLEAFYDTIEAFNLAERYQLPVIHLVDKFLANSIVSMPLPNFSEIEIERGKLVKDSIDGYKRFNLSHPISPRAPIGSKNISWYTGDEHDEFGHICEDPENREKMYRKRMEKLKIADEEIPQEKRLTYFGLEDADLLLVGWGFTKGVAVEAARRLTREGLRTAYLNIKMFSPFPSKLAKKILNKFDDEKIVAVEHNYSAQASKIIQLNTGIAITRKILKYTGRPIHLNELIDGVKKIVGGLREVVLVHGP
ncbi:MAG: 2-oxoacid:ferredoxin oxidoreductase subunit alpha [Nitrososphaerota archaeon]